MPQFALQLPFIAVDQIYDLVRLSQSNPRMSVLARLSGTPQGNLEEIPFLPAYH